MTDDGPLAAALVADREFALTARFLTGRIGLAVDGEGERVVVIADGHVTDVRTAEPGETPEIRVGASAAEWRELLARVPRPFYQDLWGASFRHGFRVEGDDALVAAYYPALRRLVDVLRETSAG